MNQLNNKFSRIILMNKELSWYNSQLSPNKKFYRINWFNLKYVHVEVDISWISD